MPLERNAHTLEKWHNQERPAPLNPKGAAPCPAPRLPLGGLQQWYALPVRSRQGKQISSPPAAGGNWAKFASDVDPKAVVREALTSPNAQFLPNGTDPNSFRVVTDLGRVVGSKGETVVRVVVDFSGKIWTALPVKSR